MCPIGVLTLNCNRQLLSGEFLRFLLHRMHQNDPFAIEKVEYPDLTRVCLKPQFIEVLLKPFGVRLWQSWAKLLQQAPLKEELPLRCRIQSIDKFFNRRSPAFGLEIVRGVLSQITDLY